MKPPPEDNARFAFVLAAIVSAVAMFGFTSIVVKQPWKKRVAAIEASLPEASIVVATEDPVDAGEADAAEAGDAAVDAPPPVATAVPPGPFNVILVTIDTLRADLGFMGYPRPITPNMDELAKKSAVFERTYTTASYTMKALSALLTGRYASEAYRDFNHYTLFPKDNVFLAERLKDGGVHTMAFHCHRYFGMRAGMEQGFDVWDMSAMPPNMVDADPRPTSKLVTDSAMRVLGKVEHVEGKPFFAWLHYFDPHSPYVGHEGAPAFAGLPTTAEKGARDVYDAEVWYTDVHLGRLFDWIATQSWASTTALVVTADHGEAFGEKGFFRHNKELWEPIVRVPLLLYIPGGPATRISIKRSHVDLVPTILELMHVPATEPALRGKSLLADLRGGALEERDVLLDMPEGQMNEHRRALITGPTPGMKLVERNTKIELYDLATDEAEKEDLSRDEAKLAPIRTKFDAAFGALESRKPIR